MVALERGLARSNRDGPAHGYSRTKLSATHAGGLRTLQLDRDGPAQLVTALDLAQLGELHSVQQPAAVRHQRDEPHPFEP